MIFFEESGLGQHYRTINKKDAKTKVLTTAQSKTQEIQDSNETLTRSVASNKRLGKKE